MSTLLLSLQRLRLLGLDLVGMRLRRSIRLMLGHPLLQEAQAGALVYGVVKYWVALPPL